MRKLSLWESYTREEAHDIFEPDTVFTPQAGTWGLQGIVRLENDGDFVFFVTFGTPSAEYEFEEEIREDGVLTWQSQPSQRLDTPRILKFISHDDLTNSIHLFLRTKTGIPYTYFGVLGYLDHDRSQEAPVHFSWQLMNWPAPSNVLEGIDLQPIAPLEPIAPTASQDGILTWVDPPVVTGNGRGGRGGGARATLPGQDAKNRALGLAGEHLVISAEVKRLRASGRADLADAIVHVAVVEGDSAGYDVRSFNPDGSLRHIEVKTTAGPASNAFYISPNEIAFSDSHPDSYVLIRVFGYDQVSNSGNCYEKVGPVAESFGLVASTYRAALLPSAE